MNRKATALLTALMLTCFGTILTADAHSGTPVSFIRNDGQFGEGPLFRAEAGGVTLFFEANQITYVFARSTGNQEPPNDARMSGEPGISNAYNTSKEYLAIKTEFLGANENVEVHGDNPSGPVYNYLLGNDRDKWVTNTRGFSSLIYENIYPGIDLEYYDNGHSLKYDIIVNPGADLSQVRIQYKGVQSLNRDAEGNLDISTVFGSIGEKAPYIYQVIDGARQHIDGHFETEGGDIFGFVIDDDYDTAYPLIIDPEYIYGTYLGGLEVEIGMSIAGNASGRIFLSGGTQSAGFPTTPGVYDSTFSVAEIFVSCIDPALSPENQLIWSTFIGGDSMEYAYGMAFEPSVGIVLSGFTTSGNYPVTSGSYDESFNGNWDAVISVLNTAGTDLLYSTFMGESLDDWASNIGLDASGKIIVGGFTESSNFPTTPGVFQDYYGGGPTDAWIAKLSPDGNGVNDLIFSTFLGGSGVEGWSGLNIYYRRMMGLAVTSLNDVVVGGVTGSSNFPTVSGCFDPIYSGNADGFISRIDSVGENLIYSSYLGGINSEGVVSLVLDEFDAPICGGYTYSMEFPTTQGAFNRFHSGSLDDGFITKFDLLVTQPDYSTFISSTDYAGIWGSMAVGPDGDLFFSGFCGPDLFVTENAFDTTFNGGQDAFVGRLRMAGQGVLDLIYSTYLGGSQSDAAGDLIIDPSRLLSVTGVTRSSDFPLAGLPYDTTHAGENDCFLAQFDHSSTGDCGYVIGDVNGSSGYDGLDIIYGVNFFKGGSLPAYECYCPPHGTWYVSGDVNESCSYNGLDITYGVNYFKGGSDPIPCADCPPME